MGANNSTRRVSFESDENENITVVKGIRLSENVINRMREPATPCKPNHVPTPPPSMASTVTPPRLRPVPPLFDPITSMPAPPPAVESVTPPPSELPTENVTAPTVIDTVLPSSPSPATAKPVPAPALEPVVAPPPAPAAIEQPPVEPESSPPVPESVVAPESSSTPPNPPAPPVDEEALKKKITDEMHEGFEQDRTKAEQELQAWLEEEKARIRAKVQTEAQSQVQDEVSRILSAERALAQDSLQQTLIRERLVTENERRRAELFAKQLDAREADLQKQDAFYKEQVARLEERSAQFYKVTTENYHKAADQVNAKFKRYEIHPVCADLQGQILSCYKENIGKTLNCSNIAALYLQCVNNAKQNKLRTGG